MLSLMLSDFAVYMYITSLYIWRDGAYISGLEHCEAEILYVNSSDSINTIFKHWHIGVWHRFETVLKFWHETATMFFP